MKILIVTDEWHPQSNWTVSTIEKNINELEKMGHDIIVLHPYLSGFKRISLPKYDEIVINPWKALTFFKSIYNNIGAIHIVTNEGILGTTIRSYCNWKKIPFTSSY